MKLADIAFFITAFEFGVGDFRHRWILWNS